MDKKIFLTLYNLAQKKSAVARASIFFTKASSVIFFIAYCGGGIFLAFTSDPKIIPYILAPMFTLAATLILRKLCRRTRPCTALGIKGLLGEKNSFSFPSNHSASSAVIAFALMYVNATLGILMLIAAFFTGVSRVVTSMHYPSDVLAGWILGALFALAFFTGLIA